FFLDGLDEVDEKTGGLQGLTMRILQLSKIPHVKLCVGSRPELVFASAFDKYSKLRIQDLTKEDMLKYVPETLQEVHAGSLTTGNKELLLSEVVGRSDGVFLWVSLVTKSICRGLIAHEE
ncbi:hypothetical protein DM02DRAFT_686047, partial [Periconia macrospinosa]